MIWKNRFGGLAPSTDEIEREVDEEVGLHIEMRAKDFERKGLDPKAARLAARYRFGDVERYRKEMSEIKNGHVRKQERSRYWDEIKQDIRFGLRQLSRKPALPLMIVALLAVGIGTNTAIFSVVKAVVLEPLPYGSPDRLVMLWETSERSSWIPASYPDLKDWKEQTQSFENLTGFTPVRFNLAGKEGAERVLGGLISAGHFEVLGVQPQLGRTLLPEESEPGGPRVVVISHGLWQRRFGKNPDLIGEKLFIDGEAFTVIGIMPADFGLPSPWLIGEKADIWVSLYTSTMANTMRSHRETHWLASVGRLEDDVSLDGAQAEMDTIAQRLAEQYPDSNEGLGVRVSPLQEELVGKAGGQLMMLLGGAGLVLLIVCGNVAGLMMAKATKRQTEVAVRSALGAGRARLTRQLLVENFPLSFLGGGLGFTLAVWGIQALRSLLPTDILRIDTVTFDGWVFVFTLGVSVLTGILFSLAPAWATSKSDVADSLKQGRAAVNAGFGRNRTRNLLVAVQFALTLVLANAAALMLQSYFELRHREYGFSTENVVTLGFSIQGPEYDDQNNFIGFYNEILERVDGLPGVRYAAAANKLPLEGGTNNSVPEVEGHDFSETDAPFAEMSIVSDDYFQSIGIPLLAGRGFNEEDHVEGRFSAIINETMADKLWPDENPIGKHFSISPPHQWTVVGVAGDVRQFGPERNPISEIYLPLAPLPDDLQLFIKMVRYLVVRTELDPMSVVASIRQEVAAVDPNQPVSDVRTTAGILSSALERRRFNTLLIGIFATIALILVTAGIYGVMSFFVAERTHEIGLRMALGANWRNVQRLVLLHGLKLAAIGVVVGWVGVHATTKLTESMVYGVSPTDTLTLISGTLFLVVVGLCGSIVPALRATKVDPILALRKE